MRSSRQNIGTGLSDLFFNHEHPSYDALKDSDTYWNAGASKAHADTYETERHAALVKDAGQFLLAFRMAVEEACWIITPLNAPDEVFPSAEDLADDFLARL